MEPRSAQDVRPCRRDKSYACGGGQWICPACGRTVENASTIPGRPFWHDPGPQPGGRTAGPHDCPAGRRPGADDPVRHRGINAEPRSDSYGVSELDAAITACEAEGIDPYPIMAETLREMGWTVEEPDAER